MIIVFVIIISSKIVFVVSTGDDFIIQAIYDDNLRIRYFIAEIKPRLRYYKDGSPDIYITQENPRKHKKLTNCQPQTESST